MLSVAFENHIPQGQRIRFGTVGLGALIDPTSNRLDLIFRYFLFTRRHLHGSDSLVEQTLFVITWNDCRSRFTAGQKLLGKPSIEAAR